MAFINELFLLIIKREEKSFERIAVTGLIQ